MVEDDRAGDQRTDGTSAAGPEVESERTHAVETFANPDAPAAPGMVRSWTRDLLVSIAISLFIIDVSPRTI